MVPNKYRLNVSFSSQCLNFISEIQSIIHSLVSVFFFQDDVVIYFQDHALRVSQELGDPLNGYGGDLVA